MRLAPDELGLVRVHTGVDHDVLAYLFYRLGSCGDTDMPVIVGIAVMGADYMIQSEVTWQST